MESNQMHACVSGTDCGNNAAAVTSSKKQTHLFFLGIDGAVLCSSKQAVFYSVSHTGVIFDYEVRQQKLLQV
jgi:hypothetical protein